MPGVERIASSPEPEATAKIAASETKNVAKEVVLSPEEFVGRRRRTVVLAISLLLYAISFCLPGYSVDISWEPTRVLDQPGWKLFLLSLTLVWIVPVWVANPLYIASLIQFHRGRYRSVLICMCIALMAVLGSLAFGGGWAYAVWGLSLAMLAPATIFEIKQVRFTTRDLLAATKTVALVFGLGKYLPGASSVLVTIAVVSASVVTIFFGWVWARRI